MTQDPCTGVDSIQTQSVKRLMKPTADLRIRK